MSCRQYYNLHEGRVGSGVLGLVSTNRLKVSGVGNDNGTGAVRQSCSVSDTSGGAYAFKASREVDIMIYVFLCCNVIDKKVKVRGLGRI